MRSFPTLLAVALLATGSDALARSEATRPTSGADCGRGPQGAMAVLASVGELLGLVKGCVPEDDPGRGVAEEAEWKSIQDVYASWMKNQCKEKRCVSNAFAAWVNFKDGTFFNDWEKLKPLMAGCYLWSSAGSTRLASEDLRYWTVTPVVYGKKSYYPGDGIHQVLQIRNTRTGEIRIVDGWTAAANARWAVKFGSKARAEDIDAADAFRTHDELVDEWGAPSAMEPCANRRDLLCDASSCETKSKELR